MRHPPAPAVPRALAPPIPCIHCGNDVAVEDLRAHLEMHNWGAVAKALFKPTPEGCAPTRADLVERQALLADRCVLEEGQGGTSLRHVFAAQLRRGRRVHSGNVPVLRPGAPRQPPPGWVFTAKTAALGRYHGVADAAERVWSMPLGRGRKRGRGTLDTTAGDADETVRREGDRLHPASRRSKRAKGEGDGSAANDDAPGFLPEAARVGDGHIDFTPTALLETPPSDQTAIIAAAADATRAVVAALAPLRHARGRQGDGGLEPGLAAAVAAVRDRLGEDALHIRETPASERRAVLQVKLVRQ